jgi:pimeloyl-ACP methyl ester carboxylesterase
VLKEAEGGTIVSSTTVSSTATVSNTTAPTQFVTAGDNKYAYRQFGSDPGLPLLFLQHFTGTLDGWDPAVTDPLAIGRSVILFESAGIGRSNGNVPTTVAGMASHAMRFLDALGLNRVDVLGFSLGGMVAQVIALQRASLFRRIILTGTGPEGGVGVAMDRPELLKIFVDQQMPMSEKLLKLFFATTETSQSAGREFVQRLAQRREDEDKDTPTTAEAAGAQLAAMSAWEKSGGEPYADLKKITQPVLVTNGNNDIMIPTVNSFTLSQHLPNAQLIIYPDSGHGSLFQHAGAFTSHVSEFLDRK